MRAVIQRVTSSKVAIKENDCEYISGKINKGFCVLVGITNDDTIEDVNYISKKISGLRVFEDEEGKMNKDLKDVNGEILLISQFTLYGDVRKGFRPSFTEAAKPDIAIPLYEELIKQLKEKEIKVETGKFGADMQVEINNDGPVTILLDSKKNF